MKTRAGVSMSGGVQNRVRLEEWRQQVHIASWWPWQEEFLGKWLEGQSVLAYFPLGGGKGLMSLASGAVCDGVTLWVCRDSAQVEKRMQQAQELGVELAQWEDISTQERGLILQEESVISERGTDWEVPHLQRVIWEYPTLQPEAPAWWLGLSANVARAVFPEPHPGAAWWKSAESSTDYQIISYAPMSSEIPEASPFVLPAELRFTEQRPEEWLTQCNAQKDAPTWLLGTIPPELQSETFQTITNDPVERRQQAAAHSDAAAHSQLWFSEMQDPPFALANPKSAFLSSAPNSLHTLGVLAYRATKELVWSDWQQAQNVPISLNSHIQTLQEHLTQAAQEAPYRRLYVSNSELMTALGWPLTPQPDFERGATQLTGHLKQLQKSGYLLECEEVCFHVKVHSAQRFQEVFLLKEPQLYAFWKEYKELQQRLSPIEGLKLAIQNGRTLDLRLISQALPYSVAQLNQILRTLAEKELLLTEELHAFATERSEREYQLRIGTPSESSLSIRLLQRCSEHQDALVFAALHRGPLPRPYHNALEEIAEQPVHTEQFWHKVQRHISLTGDAQELVPIAGRVLQWFEHEQTPAALILWEICSARLGLPGLDAATLRQAFPPPKQAPEEIKPYLQFLLHARKHDEPVERYFRSYALDIQDLTGFEELLDAFLSREMHTVLSRHTASRLHGFLRRYARAAEFRHTSLMQKQDDDSEQTTGSNAAPTWASAAGWANFLLGKPETAWIWFAMAMSRLDTFSPTARMRLAQVALANRQPHAALDLLHPIPSQTPLSSSQIEELRKQLFAQLAEGCRNSRNQPTCPNRDTAFCPSSADALLALSKERPELPADQYHFCLVRRLHDDLAQAETEWLRSLLTLVEGAKESTSLQRTVLRLLAERNEANLEELALLAEAHERKGDRTYAIALRHKICEQDPTNAENFQKLAYLAIQQNQLLEALQSALQATRLEPQRFPLERFVKKHQNTCFADLKLLREVLIELPAHPVFSELEKELTRREELSKKLLSQVPEIEGMLQKSQWSNAKARLEGVIEQHQDATPAVFHQLLNQIIEREAEFLQRIAHPPRKDPRQRNQALEEVATEAAQIGFFAISDQAFQQLLRFSPQYGLGYLKWARTTLDSNHCIDAYKQAIQLSRNPHQRRQNLQEFVEYLEKKGRPQSILQILNELSTAYPEEAPTLVEPLLLRLAETSGAAPEIAKGIETLVEKSPQTKKLKRVKEVLDQMDDLEPWKRALMSIKSKQ